MNFGNLSFDFGKGKIEIVGINSEKATGSITVRFPIGNSELRIHCYAGSNWQARKSWSIEIRLEEQEVVKEPTEEIEETFEEEYNDNSDD